MFETSKKKEIGVSDLTLLSKVSNEAINENLRKRFEHGEIYVRVFSFLLLNEWWDADGLSRLISDMCSCPSIRSGTVSSITLYMAEA